MNRIPKSLRRFAIDPVAWLTANPFFTTEQDGAYIRLLCFAWGDGEKEPALPYTDDKSLSRLSGLHGRWKRLGPAVRAQFTERDGKLYSAMLSKQWNDRMAALARPALDLPPNIRLGSRDPAYRGRERRSIRANDPRRADLLARDGNRCVWCGSTKRLCLDHIIPVALGGDDSDANYQVLCASCNSRKGSSELRLA